MVGSDIQIKLIMTEDTNDGTVVGKVFHGCKDETDFNALTSLQKFENSVSSLCALEKHFVQDLLF